MYIPEDKISEILNTSDIVDIISETVILKKSGRNYFGLCPFHSEKTPSFSVNDSKQIFHCFGCSVGGNVISYLMKYHGISFPEAVKMISRRYNIPIETRKMSFAKRRWHQQKEALFRLNKAVIDFYSSALLNSDSGAAARKYLSKRGITDDTIVKFKLGYSPDSWDAIVNLLRTQKISKKTAVQSGLVLERKQKNGYYDRFRKRIMFPIFDINMQVSGFGGRVMDDAMPKYMNSPETPVYNKSRILYGLHAAKQYCRQAQKVFIVEGYFDFLSLYQRGVKNCVASLGTALTPDHVRILKGYAGQMILVFDSDAAGINAAQKSIKIFLKEGIDTRVLVLPKGFDPDSYIVKHGEDKFKLIASKAKTMMRFLLDNAIETHGHSVEGRINVLNEMKQYFVFVEDSVLISVYVKMLSETLNIAEKAVLEKIRAEVIHEKEKKTRLFQKLNDKDPLDSDRREEQLISLMLNYPEILHTIKKKKVLDYFYSKQLKRIGKIIIGSDPESGAFVTDVMAKMDSDEDQNRVAEYAMKDFFLEDDVEQLAVSIANRIIVIRKKQESTLTGKIISAEKGSDSDVIDLLKQKQAEIQELHDRKNR